MPLFSTSAALRSGFAALRSNPLRTALSALGVIIGIGAMIAVLALSDGVDTSIRKQLATDGRAQTLRVTPRTADVVDGLVLPRTGAPTFSLADAEALGKSVAALGTVDLSTFGQGLVTVAPGRKPRGMALRGTRLVPNAVRERPPVAGRFYTDAEVASGAHVLVLGDGLAAALAQSLADSTAGPVTMSIALVRGADRQPTTSAGPQPTAAACRALVGRTVVVRDTPWQIIGVLPPAEDFPTDCSGAVPTPGRNRGPGGLRLLAYVPASAVGDAVLDMPNQIPGGLPTGARPSAALVVAATRIEDLPAIRKATERWLASRYGAEKSATAGGWREVVEIASYERESESIRQAMLILRLLMGAITGISLVVGGVGIMNVLLASVTERTREIGISKAVGARRRDVLMQYLAESIAISALGAVLGTILGYGVAQIVAAVMRQRATIPVHAGFSVSTLLVAIGAPLVVGLCFGMYPALRASRLSPIDAIRHE